MIYDAHWLHQYLLREVHRCCLGLFGDYIRNCYALSHLPARQPLGHQCGPTVPDHLRTTDMRSSARSFRTLRYSTIHLRRRRREVAEVRKQGGLQRSRQRRWRGWAAHSRGKCSPESFSKVSLADAARIRPVFYHTDPSRSVELSCRGKSGMRPTRIYAHRRKST